MALFIIISSLQILNYCDLMMPYGDINLGQHWLSHWLLAWRHMNQGNQCRFIISEVQWHSSIHQRVVSYWVPKHWGLVINGSCSLDYMKLAMYLSYSYCKFIEVCKHFVHNKSLVVQVMDWNRGGDKPLPEPMTQCKTNADQMHIYKWQMFIQYEIVFLK